MAMMFRLFSSIAVSKARNASASIAVVAMSPRFSSTAVISRPGHLSASTAVVNVISKHIQELSKKSDAILQMRERLRRNTKVLNRLERELLQSQPRVAHQLVFLRKLYDEIVPGGQLLHTDAQVTTTHSDKDKAPLSIVTKQLQYLQDALDFISRTEEVHYRPGVPIDQHRIEIISCKPFFVHQLIALRNIFEEVACEIEPPSCGGAFEYELKDDAVMPKSEMFPFGCYCEFNSSLLPMLPEWPLDKQPLDKHRYLLLSNGCEIHCLDLKQSKNQPMTHDVPLLPIIATLNLLAEDLPTTVGLFKWRSKVYMIGGQTLPLVPSKDVRPGVDLYRRLCMSNKVKATSCLIHGLSLDDSKTILSHSESNLLELKKPKIWPIVEELNGEIHVIDRLPSALACEKEHTWTGSHEVFDRNSGCWIEDVVGPEGDETFPILSYLVVGTNIYAKLFNNRRLLFRANKNKWHVRSDTSFHELARQTAPKREPDLLKSPHRFLASQAMSAMVWEEDGKKPHGLPKDVWCILETSLVVSGIGGFPYGDAQDPLYVVIALLSDPDVSFDDGEHAVAFLVNSSGQVLCTQSLEQFFKGFGAFEGKIIKVEEDKLGKKKTICSIVIGRQLGWSDCDRSKGYILINTFDVEELPDAADKVREVLAKGSEAWPVEMEFVRIDVLDRYVYKSDAELDGAGGWVDVQACFL